MVRTKMPTAQTREKRPELCKTIVHILNSFGNYCKYKNRCSRASHYLSNGRSFYDRGHHSPMGPIRGRLGEEIPVGRIGTQALDRGNRNLSKEIEEPLCVFGHTLLGRFPA